MAVSRGYHFYQNPGPTNIPDRVLRAMDRGAIDFTGARFKEIAEECFAGLKRVFKTDQTILARNMRSGMLVGPGLIKKCVPRLTAIRPLQNSAFCTRSVSAPRPTPSARQG